MNITLYSALLLYLLVVAHFSFAHCSNDVPPTHHLSHFWSAQNQLPIHISSPVHIDGGNIVANEGQGGHEQGKRALLAATPTVMDCQGQAATAMTIR